MSARGADQAEGQPRAADPPDVIPATPEPGEDWYADDPALRELLGLCLPGDLVDEGDARLAELGRIAPARIDALARLADRHRPILHRRSPEGERIDHVEFHPAYEALKAIAREHRTFTLPWHGLGDHERPPRALGFALGYLYAQAESGYYCPACMTDGAAFVLERHAPDAVRDRYLDGLVSLDVDGGLEGAMYLTEKGGGSDVGGGTATVARRAGDDADPETWHLTGEKWFASNCVADVCLALARMPDDEGGDRPGSRGIGLFVVPRHLPDGSPNPGLRTERLKDKLGVTSMPTGEVVLDDAVGYLVKGAGDGFKAMLEMVNLSRLYNAVASVATARRALREGQRAGRHRIAFGKPLREQPLFLKDLTEMTVEIEGALAFTLDTADVFDRWARADDEAQVQELGRLLRMLTPCAKAMTAKLAVSAASRGCELLGGVGYIEEYVTPRLLRDAQVLPIWEGTTNIQGLEFLRAVGRDNGLDVFVPHVKEALLAAGHHRATEDARTAVVASLKGIGQEAKRLADAERADQEVACLRLLARCYHTHATALLVRRAPTSGDVERASLVANLYAAMHLGDGRETGARELERVAANGDERVAFPAPLKL